MPRKANTRAASGAGSIRQRPDGRWEARVTVGNDPGTDGHAQAVAPQHGGVEAVGPGIEAMDQGGGEDDAAHPVYAQDHEGLTGRVDLGGETEGAGIGGGKYRARYCV